MNDFIQPNWPAPDHVRAYSTTKFSGNLADHVGDSAKTVNTNRQQLNQTLNLPSSPRWLTQVHGTEVVNAKTAAFNVTADASYSAEKNIVCGILTADCLPILFCNQQGNKVAATHAGWRGLATGIIENTIQQLKCAPDELLVWLGPAVGNKKYEIRQDVYDVFIKQNIEYKKAFHQINESQWLADMYLLARMRLKTLGVEAVFGGEHCTFSDEKNFYSFRRDGEKTGRMLSLIWLTD